MIKRRHTYKHGFYGTPTYASWMSMKRRVDSPTDRNKKYYFDKGISYDPRWKKFEPFLEDMGKRPKGKTLDRINNDGHYCKENCRWATSKQQVENRANTRRYKGKTFEWWSKKTGISKSNLVARYYERGWSIEKTLTTPTIGRNEPRPWRVKLK